MIRFVIVVNSIIGIVLAALLLVFPPARAILNLRDPALKKPGVPKIEWRLLRQLTPRYADWAKERMSHGAGSLEKVESTEWPVFGSVLYLWAVEDLQKAWDGGDHTGGLEPKVYCKDAILAASELVIDPKQAGWVRRAWGTNYLHREDVFYRMLLIGALTSRQELLRDDAHLDMLRDQAANLSKELDASRTGLLDDYPNECYPCDVIAAVACIHRANGILRLDDLPFVARSLRAFTGKNSSKMGLPPSLSKAITGVPLAEPRGCANSFLCLTAPGLWPAPAKKWFQLYVKNFWQEDLGFAGFREYVKNMPGAEWSLNVDAGPVVDGFGVSAGALGVGAARKNGRFDLAYPLAAEMLATAWELPDGTLALPRTLSSASDAPFLGEAAVLFVLSAQPEKGFPAVTGGSIPPFVYIVLGISLLLGLWRIEAAYDALKSIFRGASAVAPWPAAQIVVWLGLMAGAGCELSERHWLIALCLAIIAQILPFGKRKSSAEEAQDWDTPLPQKENSPPA